MPSEMLERCAALCSEMLQEEFDLAAPDDVPYLKGQASRLSRQIARAVLEALREPSEAMVNAFWDCHAEADTVFAEPADLFRAMIDTALKDTSE